MKKYSLLPVLLIGLFLTNLCSRSTAQPISIDMRSYIVPEKKIYKQGEIIKINFSGFPGFQKDWIGIYRQIESNRNYLTWKYTGGNKNGVIEFEVPKEPGRYELRGFADNQYERFVTSEIFTVRSADLTLYNTDWAGTWRTNFSDLAIEQSGITVTGKYNKGRIVAIANGNIITGSWYEGSKEGRFEFVMSGDGKTFTGKFGNNYDDLSKTWNGTKIITSGRAIPTLSPVKPKKNNDTPDIRANGVLRQVTATDLAGIWDATGYTCETSIAVEKIKITVNGNKLTAVKITGDNCVPKGEITWEGTLSGNIISGRGRVSSGAGTPIRWLEGITVKVKDKNTLEGFLGVTYRRQSSTSGYQAKWTIDYDYTNGPKGTFFALLKPNGSWDYAKGSNRGLKPDIENYGTWKITGTGIVLTWKEPAYHGTYTGTVTDTTINGSMESFPQNIRGTWKGRKAD